MTSFESLTISRWQQFGEISLQFDNQATIITGANASGKTTLLGLLARHANWTVPSLATPWKEELENLSQDIRTPSDDPVSAAAAAHLDETKKTRSEPADYRFVSRLFRQSEVTDATIGQLSYDDGNVTPLTVPQTNSAPYAVAIANQRPVKCFFVPSHRGTYRYVPIGQIPTTPIDRENAYNRVVSAYTSRHFGQGGNPSSYFMKETLLAWSIFGRGNVDMEPDTNALTLFQGFQEVLRQVLPPTLGFKKFSIRKYEITLDCASADFLLDAASGGISTLIDLAWMIYMFSPPEEGFTVVIDEVENHLHPTMQRRLLADLLKAFPKVRFIVSTHSPLIVTSVRDATVYALKYRGNEGVVSEKLDFQNKARTATQVLDEILGISSTLPIWAETELEAVVREFSASSMDEAAFAAMRTRLESLGLDAYLPLTLGRALEAKQR